MRLHNIQTHFKNLILDHPDALNTPDDKFSNQFEDTTIPLPRRLKVYRNNIIGSLTDMMIATFPMVDNLVGRAFFENMARSFIMENPPSQGCLNHYGEGFDIFLQSYKPVQSLTYLPDIAHLESAMNNAYYARDQKAMTAQDLQNISPEDLPETILNLADHVHLIRSDHPLLAIKAFIDNGSKGTLNLDQNGDTFIVSRPDLDTVITPIDDKEYMILQAFQNNIPLGQAVERTMAKHPDFDFGHFLGTHLSLKTFAAMPA